MHFQDEMINYFLSKRMRSEEEVLKACKGKETELLMVTVLINQ